MSLTVVDETQLSDLLGNGRPIVVDFTADWCAPCRAIAPELEKLASTTDDVDFVEIDIDAHPGITQQLRVMSVPTVIHFGANGGEVARSVGAVRAEQLALRLGLTTHRNAAGGAHL